MHSENDNESCKIMVGIFWLQAPIHYVACKMRLVTAYPNCSVSTTNLYVNAVNKNLDIYSRASSFPCCISHKLYQSIDYSFRFYISFKYKPKLNLFNFSFKLFLSVPFVWSLPNVFIHFIPKPLSSMPVFFVNDSLFLYPGCQSASQHMHFLECDTEAQKMYQTEFASHKLPVDAFLDLYTCVCTDVTLGKQLPIIFVNLFRKWHTL